jgi:hypothetical protein
MSEQLEKQWLLMRLIPRLIDKIHEAGYECTGGHLMRCENCYTGSDRSLHRKKLAIDINLFMMGNYITDTEAHRPFGIFWESLHPDCCWGGGLKHESTGKDFLVSDGNHYSISFAGME